MRQFKSRGEAALYLWDYFYCTNRPAEGDEKPWRLIEGAAHRILESEQYLKDRYPAEVRLHHARRVRRAVRTIIRNIERLSEVPELWIAGVLGALEGVADVEIAQATSADPPGPALH